MSSRAKRQRWMPATLTVTVLAGCSAGPTPKVDAGPSTINPCMRPCPDAGHICYCCMQTFIDQGLCDGGPDDTCIDMRTPTGRCDPNERLYCFC